MVTVSFPTAEAVTNAILALPLADRGRCIARQVETGFAVDAPDDLESALKADHPTAPLPVPASVSSAQAKIALKRAGYLPAVKHVVDALEDEEISIWFTDARVWERYNPHVLAVAGALNLSEGETDTLFQAAAQIAA